MAHLDPDEIQPGTARSRSAHEVHQEGRRRDDHNDGRNDAAGARAVRKPRQEAAGNPEEAERGGDRDVGVHRPDPPARDGGPARGAPQRDRECGDEEGPRGPAPPEGGDVGDAGAEPPRARRGTPRDVREGPRGPVLPGHGADDHRLGRPPWPVRGVRILAVLTRDNRPGNAFNGPPDAGRMAGKPRVGSAFRRAVGEPVLPDGSPRLPGGSVLLNERRRKVFLTVLDRPGIHLRELARSLALPLQSLSWHVEILRKAGLLASHRIGKFASLSVQGQADVETLRDLALLDVVKNAAIVRVPQRRSRTRSQVSGDLKVYPQALDPSLRSLFVRGLIARDPGRVEFEIGARMEEILEEFRDSTSC